MMRVGLLRMRSVFKASVFVTTGGTEGIRLEEIPIHERARAHHERLRLSEFGLVCLWSLVDSSLLEIYPVGQVTLCCRGGSTLPLTLMLVGRIQASCIG